MLWEEASGIFQGKVCPERIAGCACAASNLQALAVRACEQWLPSRSCEQFKPFPGISALQTLVQVALQWRPWYTWFKATTQLVQPTKETKTWTQILRQIYSRPGNETLP